ncbi:peptidylprolyl isomerase [Crocinitomicaceae bacterium]|nr:peptidylprolyl isomerase [Crocinitomicaceae bacterium]
MKGIKLLVASILFSSVLYAQKDPVILTINNEEIHQSDFLSVYLKNNNDPKFDKESLDNYVELYKRFKLKVAEAEALGYDKDPELIKELDGYRKTLARPYLVDSAKNEALIREAYERSKYEIRASHILVMVAEDASPKDTLKAFNKISAFKKRIDGGASFEDVATGKDGSEDPSVKQNNGDLGYFTAFQMVYPFESVAFSTPVGQIGGPLRTKYGYHLIKVADKRAARGTISAAHIMVAVAADGDPMDVENAEKKINEIYEKLEKGEEFGQLARLYSDDNGSKGKGGRLPQFGTGTSQRMVSEFEDAAFALTKDNEYSKPFRTDYGFHIVQRIDYTPLGSYEEMYKGLQSKVNRGERGQKTQESFIIKLKKENKFKDLSKKTLKWFLKEVDSTIFQGTWERQNLTKNGVLFTYSGIKFYQNDFKQYLAKNQRRSKPMNIENYVNENYKKWQNQLILEDEEGKLEGKYPEFKALMKEYHDGVLLYEIMKDKVWDKAIQDTTGLQNFFAKNSGDYNWPDRIDADVYSANDQVNAQAAFDLLSSTNDLSAKQVADSINNDSQLNIRLESSKYALETTSFLAGQTLKKGVNSIFEHAGKFYVIVVKEFLESQPKTLVEARGAVIQDYQNHLEETWLNELRDKHIITVQSEVLYSLGK